MPTNLGRRYFRAIQKAWLPFAGRHRIIPFCTPIIERPTAVVIGTNHSDFVAGGGEQSERIADRFSRRIPDESTFLVHDHKFARGLREVCKRAGIEIDKTWIGTNRCAVQTGPGGLEKIQNHQAFAGCQVTMDQVLRDFVEESLPRNVILAGKYATELYYERANRSLFSSLKPHEIRISGVRRRVRVIPIEHPSRPGFWQSAADRLHESFVR